MEPICWLGIAGIVGVTVAICGIFSKSCKGQSSTCGCDTKQETPLPKESGSSKTGIDDKKEKAIKDLIK